MPLLLRSITFALTLTWIATAPAFAEADGAVQAGASEAADAAVDTSRVEAVEEESNRRYLVSSFRRTSSATPKKILL